MSEAIIHSKINALKTVLRDMQYRTTWKEDLLSKGDPKQFLIIFNFLFIQYNQLMNLYVVNKGYYLQTATDLEFMQQVFRFISSEFSYKIAISINDFFKNRFALQKLNMALDISKLVRDKVKTL